MKDALKNIFRVVLIMSLTNTLLPSIIYAQEKTSIVSILSETFKVYQGQGLDGVKDYATKNKDKLNGDSIIVISASVKNMPTETSNQIALTMAESINDKNCIAWCEYYLGYNFFQRKKDDIALNHLSKALQLFVEMKDLKGEAFAHDYIGQLYERNKKFTSANESFLNLIRVSRELTNNYLQGWGYLKLGQISFASGNNQDAIKMFSNALTFFEKAEETRLQASTHFELGTVYTETNDLEVAIESFSKTAELYKILKDTSGTAAAYNVLGTIYEHLNNFQKALEMYSISLSYYEKTFNPLGIGNLFYSIGKIYLNTGDSKKATEMFAKALPLFIIAKDPIGAALVYVYFGDMYAEADNKPKALSMYTKALPYVKKAQRRYLISELYLRIGEQFKNFQNYQESIDTYSDALSIYEIIQDLSGQVKVYLETGDVYAKMGETSKAFEKYAKASTIIDKANAPILKANLFLAEANLFNKQKDNQQAFEKYNTALSILEKVRTETGFAEMKMSFVEKISQSMEEAILFMITNNYPDKAFQYLESTKARTLLDQLAEKNIGQVDKGLSPGLIKTRDKLASKLSFVKSSLTKAVGDSTIIVLQKTQNNLENEWEKLSQKIRFQNPAYATIMYPQTVSIQELQKKILKPEEALLNYFVSTDDIYVCLITTNDFKIIKLPNSRSFIENEVQSYQRNLQYNRPVYESSLNHLLIEPVLEHITKKKTLLIAPDGFLTTIPFESIIVGFDEATNKTKYLIEDYTIKYIQSATMLSLLRTTLKRTHTSDKFIGLGDPVYDYQNFIAGKPEKGEQEKNSVNLKSNSYDRSGGLMIRLEGSGMEVREIAKIFGKNKSKILTRTDAREEKIKNDLIKDYGYIVLSCHGLASDEFQSLVLSQIPNSEEDGYLTLDEIMNLDWNAQLVVLSACQTGKGKIRKGEGVIGLTRAVMHAGTSAAIVSLWNVSDEGTKELMIKLFQNIVRNKLSKEEALKKAKIEMLNSKFSNPFFWSAFVMYGE